MNTTNIKLDAGMTAFIDTVNYKLLRQARSCRLLTLGLLVCGVYTAWSVKHIKELESKVNNDDINYTGF